MKAKVMVTLADMFGPGFVAVMGAFILVFLVILLAVYIYIALALMAIAKRTKTSDAWLAFIPIANIYLMTKIAKQPGWWTLSIFLAFIPMIGGILFAATLAFLWWHIAKRLKKPEWWGILAVLPVVNLIVMGIMAWGK